MLYIYIYIYHTATSQESFTAFICLRVIIVITYAFLEPNRNDLNRKRDFGARRKYRGSRKSEVVNDERASVRFRRGILAYAICIAPVIDKNKFLNEVRYSHFPSLAHFYIRVRRHTIASLNGTLAIHHIYIYI